MVCERCSKLLAAYSVYCAGTQPPSHTPLKLPSRKKLSVQRKAWVQDETLVMEELAMGKTEGSVEMKVPLRMLSGSNTRLKLTAGLRYLPVRFGVVISARAAA